MTEEPRQQANRFVKGLSVFVGLNGVYMLSWPFIGLYHCLCTRTPVFMGPVGMIICIIIGSIMVKTPLQVFRDYSRTALAGVILGVLISLTLDGIILMGIIVQSFNI